VGRGVHSARFFSQSVCPPASDVTRCADRDALPVPDGRRPHTPTPVRGASSVTVVQDALTGDWKTAWWSPTA